MSWTDEDKLWKCEVCARVVKSKDMLRAPSPFDVADELVGCPHCLTATGDGSWQELCEREGCGKPATCGTPLPDGGYLRCCFKHYQEVNKND